MDLARVPSSWFSFFQAQMSESYFASLASFVEEAYASGVCYPPKQDLYKAFESCSLEALKVVIIGQDPYHGPGQANGLSFSVAEGVKHPPSLVNIFKELESDLGIPIPLSGNLEAWANQGVLLLNSVLSVSQAKAGSHAKKGWEVFTDAAIEHVNKECNNVVFLLWGNYAHKKGKHIDTNKHLVLSTGHPSPLSANRGYWFGNKCFSKANTYLELKGKAAIAW